MLSSRRIKTYLAAMAQRGIPARDILDCSYVTDEDLDDPAFVTDLAQSQVLISNMLRCSGNSALGLELGENITIADMGVVGYGMSTAPTIRDAIGIWRQYAPSLYGTLINMEITERTGRWQVGISASQPLGEGYRFCIEEFLSQVLALGDHLCGYPIEISALQLVYPPPQHADQYDALFKCPVTFGAPENRLSVRRPTLDDPVQNRDQYLYGIYQTYCEQQSGRESLGGLVSHRLRNYLIKNLGAQPKVGAAAAQLGMSVSTLYRRLTIEGVSYGEVLADFRCNFAKAYLRETNMSIKEIAFLLGYRDSKPFLRSFKDWTGVTSGEFRKQAQDAKGM